MEGQRPHAWAWGLVALIAFGLALAGYLCFAKKGPAKPTVPVRTLTLGVEASVLPAAVWVAEDKGYFQDAGLALHIEEFDSGRLSLEAMLSGQGIDICTVAPTPMMFESLEREDFCIVATFVYSYEDIKVIARRDKGINAPKDLRRRKIGTPARTTGAFLLAVFLAFNEVAASEVEVIDISPSDLPTALERNEVDAIVIWEPHAGRAQKLLGEKAIRLPTLEMYRTTFNFVVMKEFAEDHPEALVRFLEGISQATTFIGDHRQEAQAIVARRLGVGKQAVTAVWDAFVFGMSLDQSLLVTLEQEARWAIRNGFTDKVEVPNFLDFMYLEAMEKVKPEAVSIIR